MTLFCNYFDLNMEEHFFGGVKIPFMDYIKMTVLSVIGVEFRDKILQLGHYAPLFGHQDLDGDKDADLILEDVNGYLTSFNVQKRDARKYMSREL